MSTTKKLFLIASLITFNSLPGIVHAEQKSAQQSIEQVKRELASCPEQIKKKNGYKVSRTAEAEGSDKIRFIEKITFLPAEEGGKHTNPAVRKLAGLEGIKITTIDLKAVQLPIEPNILSPKVAFVQITCNTEKCIKVREECGNEICTKNRGNLTMKDRFFTKRDIRWDCPKDTSGRVLKALNTAARTVQNLP